MQTLIEASRLHAAIETRRKVEPRAVWSTVWFLFSQFLDRRLKLCSMLCRRWWPQSLAAWPQSMAIWQESEESEESLTFAAARFIAGALKGEHVGAQQADTLHDLAAQVFVARHASDLSGAVFRMAQHALSLPLAPKAPINAEVMAAACASVAGLALETGKSHVLRVLEELARHVIIFQAFAYSFISRTGFGQIKGLDEATYRMQASLAAAGVWLFTAFGRSVDQSCLNASTLWEWASGDALYACMMVRNTLTLVELADVASPHGFQIPGELSILQRSMVQSLLGLSGTDVAFSFADQVEVQRPSMYLLLHRARLALALYETNLVPLLLDSLEGLQISAVELASFLGKLLGAELLETKEMDHEEELVEACRMALALFRDGLAVHQERLWAILSSVPPRTRLLRSFLRDCAGLAMVLPSECCVELLACCKLAQDSKDWAALAGLCCIASHGSLGPAEVPQLSGVLMNLMLEEKEAVLQQFQRWPSAPGECDAWKSLLQCPMTTGPLQSRDLPPKPPPSPLEAKHRRLLAAGLEALLVDPPPELSCSLDGRLLTYPVRSPDGDVFDAASLACYLTQSGGTCPSGHILTLDICQVDEELQRSCLKHIKRWARGMAL
eukprot:s164_g60.t1